MTRVLDFSETKQVDKYPGLNESAVDDCPCRRRLRIPGPTSQILKPVFSAPLLEEGAEGKNGDARPRSAEREARHVDGQSPTALSF